MSVARFVAAAAVALAGATSLGAAPPPARSLEDEAFVRALVAEGLVAPLEAWARRSADDAPLAARVRLAARAAAGDRPEPADWEELLDAADDDPRRAFWALDLAESLLLEAPRRDGRLAMLAVGVVPAARRAEWREEWRAGRAALERAEADAAAWGAVPAPLAGTRAFRDGLAIRRAWLAELAEALGGALGGTAERSAATAPNDPEGIEPPDDVRLARALAALARGDEAPLRALAGAGTPDPWTRTAAACALDLHVDDNAADRRLRERAASLRNGPPALALLAADAAVRGGAGADRCAAWRDLLEVTPAARRAALRGAILARVDELAPPDTTANLGAFELALRGGIDPVPTPVAEELLLRPFEFPAGSPDEATRLLGYARLRQLALRGRLDEAATLAESLATRLGDDPIAAAAAETLVAARTALADARGDAASATAERDALALALARCPTHPRRDRWRIALALARLDADDPRGAAEAAAGVAAASPLGPEAQAVEALARLSLDDASAWAKGEAILAAAPDATDADTRARLALARGLARSRRGEADAARVAAETVAAERDLPLSLRGEAMRLALALGGAPAPHAASGLVAASVRTRVALVAAIRAAIAAPEPDARRLALLLAALGDAEPLLDARDRLAIADARLATGDAAAAADVAATIAASVPAGDPLALDATLLRIRALRARGGEASLAEAFALARDLGRGAANGSPLWWEANALQLELLARSGRNPESIPPWINRLRALDPGLGGPATKARIEAIAAPAPGGTP